MPKEKGKMTYKSTKEKGKKSKSKSEKRQRFIFKTIIDGFLIGLIAIGVFLGRPPNEKPLSSYIWILCILGFIIILLIIYSIKYSDPQTLLGLFIIIFISIIEVSLIGMAFQESVADIFITILIVSPSVIIFDKLLG